LHSLAWEAEQRRNYISSLAGDNPDLATEDVRQRQLDLLHDGKKWEILNRVVTQNTVLCK
jgi:hypothetical protein